MFGCFHQKVNGVVDIGNGPSLVMVVVLVPLVVVFVLFLIGIVAIVIIIGSPPSLVYILFSVLSKRSRFVVVIDQSLRPLSDFLKTVAALQSVYWILSFSLIVVAIGSTSNSPAVKARYIRIFNPSSIALQADFDLVGCILLVGN